MSAVVAPTSRRPELLKRFCYMAAAALSLSVARA
jgi:hypothetical protein